MGLIARKTLSFYKILSKCKKHFVRYVLVILLIVFIKILAEGYFLFRITNMTIQKRENLFENENIFGI